MANDKLLKKILGIFEEAIDTIEEGGKAQIQIAGNLRREFKESLKDLNGKRAEKDPDPD